MTSHDLPRRRLLQGAAGGLAAGGLAAGGAMWGFDRSGAPGSVTASGPGRPAADGVEEVDLSTTVPFYDQPHPAGVQTPQQRYVVFMTFDIVPGSTASDLQVLLARWSAAIAQLAAGKPIGLIDPPGDSAVGQDTGEAAGLAPASLTVTLGLGPSVFDKRFGLAAKKPPLLAALPALPSDNLVPAQSGGDLSLQACADDPQVAYHAIRNLARMARTTVHTRWTVLGFGRASAGAGQQTPRNLFGFKDGTRNVKEPVDFDQHVWIKDGWMAGGTYQVVRKIDMDIEIWDADRISDQQRIFGRTKNEGGPLSGGTEFATPDFAKNGADGQPLIDPRSHVALASPENNGGVRICRRSYNFTDGINDSGQLDAGLLFVAYMNDPKHFVDLQRKLGSSDLMNEYVKHVGSGIFAVPPTPKTGHYIGETLFT